MSFGPADVATAAERLRRAAAQAAPGEQIAEILANACRPEPAAAEEIAANLGWSPEVIKSSLRALSQPFSSEELREFARKASVRHDLFGFILPGNIPGAGLHEVVMVLLAGGAALVKTATAEPVFFKRFAERLADFDPSLASRIAIFNWDRDQADLTAALMGACDRLIVLGEDQTVARLGSGDRRAAGNGERRADLIGFGTRVSGMVVTGGALHRGNLDELMERISFDIMAFEQRGCLSPHHLFIEDAIGVAAYEFANQLATTLEVAMRVRFPAPGRLGLQDAIAIRRIREQARWRGIGGEEVRLWEGPIPGWAVIYDRGASFAVSPGFRTVYVSAFSDPGDLERRLEAVSGRLEGFALTSAAAIDSAEQQAAFTGILERAGATYLCDAGKMHSPPLSWRHGGGAFYRMITGSL